MQRRAISDFWNQTLDPKIYFAGSFTMAVQFLCEIFSSPTYAPGKIIVRGNSSPLAREELASALNLPWGVLHRLHRCFISAARYVVA